MTILYTVVLVDKNEQDAYVYLRTLDSKKAQRLHSRIAEHYPDVEVITYEIDEPVWFVDLKFIDGGTTANAILVGCPEDDPELKSKKVDIVRRERLV